LDIDNVYYAHYCDNILSNSEKQALKTWTEIFVTDLKKKKNDRTTKRIAYGLFSHGVTKENLDDAGTEKWRRNLETAMEMSADVCTHYDNYIRP